jgi:succinate-acetate transporter protein
MTEHETERTASGGGRFMGHPATAGPMEASAAVPRLGAAARGPHPLPGRVNPAPLAFGAFAGTTFILSWVNTGQISATTLEAAVATAWVFGGIIQILVGFWHFRNEDLFPAVTFASFGAFWVGFALFGTLYLDKVPPAKQDAATALFLFPWAVFSLYMFIGSFRTNVAVVIAYALVLATLILLIIGHAQHSVNTIKVGGWVGVALAIEVWYLAGAEMINHQFSRTLLPLGPLTHPPGEAEFDELR